MPDRVPVECHSCPARGADCAGGQLRGHNPASTPGTEFCLYRRDIAQVRKSSRSFPMRKKFV